MNSIDFSFSEYHKYFFSSCLSEFSNQLIFKGITYYERYLIFEHLKPYASLTFINFLTNNVELIFNGECLVGMHIYISEKDIDKVIGILEALLDKNSLRYSYSDYHIVSDKLKINGYWLDSKFIVAVIGGNEICIYIGLKEFNITIIDTNI